MMVWFIGWLRSGRATNWVLWGSSLVPGVHCCLSMFCSARSTIRFSKVGFYECTSIVFALGGITSREHVKQIPLDLRRVREPLHSTGCSFILPCLPAGPLSSPLC